MREIKFRAYWYRAKKMTKDFGLDDYAQDHDGTHGDADYPSLYDVERGEAVIMQYTGLKDRNGKEIYEGDVIEVEFIVYPESKKEKIESKYISQVTFQDGCFVFYDDYESHVPCQPCFRTKIIGNIYENPELLKEVE